MSSVEDWLIRQIAEQDRVPVDSVTIEYIHRQREDRLYQSKRPETATKYGGYNSHGLKILTRQEAEEAIKRADAALAEI